MNLEHFKIAKKNNEIMIFLEEISFEIPKIFIQKIKHTNIKYGDYKDIVDLFSTIIKDKIKELNKEIENL